MGTEGLIIVISAPSGTGKSTLCSGLKSRFPAMQESISCTTRQPRNGEADGVDYHFVTPEIFSEMQEQGKFIEWAQVHGDLYGTPLTPLDEARKSGTDILLDIDCQGAKRLMKMNLHGVFIFLLPPSMAELRRRLESRSSDAPEVVERRLSRAAGEIREAPAYDHIVVNDNQEEALKQLEAIVISSRTRTGRMIGHVEALLQQAEGMIGQGDV